MASAAPPSSFPSLIQNSFVPSIDTNLSLLDFESKYRFYFSLGALSSLSYWLRPSASIKNSSTKILESLMDLDYFKLLKLSNDEVPNDDILRELNHKRQIETEDLFYDPLRDRLLQSTTEQSVSNNLSEPTQSPEDPVVPITEAKIENTKESDPVLVTVDTVQVKADENPDSESDLEDWLDSVIWILWSIIVNVRDALMKINMYVSCSSYFIGRQYENKKTGFGRNLKLSRDTLINYPPSGGLYEVQIFGGQEHFSLTQNLVVAPELSWWLRDIRTVVIYKFRLFPDPIIPYHTVDIIRARFGESRDRPEVPSIGWHLTYTRCKREKHGNKNTPTQSVAFEQMCEK